jgi:hypothetical protein
MRSCARAKAQIDYLLLMSLLVRLMRSRRSFRSRVLRMYLESRTTTSYLRALRVIEVSSRYRSKFSVRLLRSEQAFFGNLYILCNVISRCTRLDYN